MKNLSDRTLLLILIVLALLFGFNKAGNRLDQLSDQVKNLSQTVDSQNRQYSRMEELLAKQASIIDSYDIAYGAIDSSLLTYQVTLQVIPKESKKNTTAAYTIGDLKGDMKQNGAAFSAVLNVPINGEFHPLVTFSEAGESRSETLDAVISFAQNYLYKIKGDFSGEKTYHDKELRYKGSLILFYGVPQGSMPETSRVFATLNDQEILSQEIAVEPQKEIRIDFNKTFAVGYGDRFALFFEIKDSTGLIYRCPIDSTAIAADGKSRSENYLQSYEYMIFDRNGKEILSQ